MAVQLLSYCCSQGKGKDIMAFFLIANVSGCFMNAPVGQCERASSTVIPAYQGCEAQN